MECLILYYIDMGNLSLVLCLMIISMVTVNCGVLTVVLIYGAEFCILDVRMFPYELIVDNVNYWKH